MAQDLSSKNRKGPNWAMVEKQIRNVEKHLTHYTNLALQHWGATGFVAKRKDKIKERPILLRRRRERVKAEANWKLFYWKFSQDHALPNLIWNHKVTDNNNPAIKQKRLIKTNHFRLERSCDVP